MGEPFYQQEHMTFNEIKNMLLKDYSVLQTAYPSELTLEQSKTDFELDNLVRVSINHFLGNEYYKKGLIEPDTPISKFGSIRGYITFIHSDLLNIFTEYMAKDGFQLNPKL